MDRRREAQIGVGLVEVEIVWKRYGEILGKG